MIDFESFLTVVGVGDTDGGTGSLPPEPESVERSLDCSGEFQTWLVRQVEDEINLGTAGFTITGFIRPTFLDAPSNTRIFLQKGHVLPASASYLLACTRTGATSGRIYAAISDGVNLFELQTADGSVLNDTWHFFTLSLNTTTNIMSLSIDRGTAVTLGSVNDPQSITSDFRLGGGEETGLDPFIGQCSLFGIWGRVLSGTELDEVYNNGIGILWDDLQAGTQADCIGYWELDEFSDGTTAVSRHDSSTDLPHTLGLQGENMASSGEVPS